MNLEEMIARQQQIVSGARNEGRGLTQEEQREFDNLQTQIDAARNAGGSANPPAGGQDEAQRAAQLERQRIQEITTLGREFGMDVETHINNGDSIETVRQAVLNHLRAQNRPLNGGRGGDGNDNFLRDAADSILLRAGIPVENHTEDAENLRQMSLRDLAIECMVRDNLGSTTSLLRMSKDELWNMACRQFFNPTSAFPAILDSAIKKGIVHLYQEVPTTFQHWTSRGSLSDFKPSKDHSYLMGGAGEFLHVGETGELKHDKTETEKLPERKLDTYGRQFSMTRQAFINDDIGFITEMPGKYAASAKRTINKQVYQILCKNPVIHDGVKLFDAAHKNLMTVGSAPNQASIQKMIMTMMLQQDPFGENIMIQPGFIVVPVGYGFSLTTIFESPTIQTTENTQAVNPLYRYRNKLQIVEEAQLNVNAGIGAAPWFMVADKTYAKSIQVDYLNGKDIPTIRRMETPGQLGFVWDIFLDWGITVMDPRGINMNPGEPLVL